ncbi:MAG: hypothetical protein CL967_05505 [Euryarchaeota archaeon]|nr:hypothetical protein [Euryarchaeota archaeon]|tara:strand:+ start:156 stop:389 length:234 start_codon:yes stop_codon:yes gene_type:complete
MTGPSYWCDGSLESVEASSTEVPEDIRNQIIAGITKEEVPTSVVAAIEAEAVAAMTPEELKDAYETISKQCESWGIS